MLKTVFEAFGITDNADTAVPYGSGLINSTWKIHSNGNTFILQRINHEVFKVPQAIAHNIAITGKYLQQHYPDYLFVLPVKSVSGYDFFFEETRGYFRLMPFVENSHTIEVAKTPELAFEAAKQFGKFTRLLSNFDPATLQITLPDFHNLTLRYHQFEHAVATGNKKRILQAADLIAAIRENKYIVDIFEHIKRDPEFKIRVAHHDTKISNVLFDPGNQGICVIDLDTLMPGYFISDLGDMLRTYLSPVSEEEPEYSKIEIRDDYFVATVEGYLSEMHDELSAEEKQHLVYAGKFMIYMQAIRFLADHIQNDIYYGAKYEGHNLIRAGNQMTLLKKLTEKEDRLMELVENLVV